MTTIEIRFAEMAQAEGFEAWYETEARWEEWEEQMVTEGFDAEEVREFFNEMALDL